MTTKCYRKPQGQRGDWTVRVKWNDGSTERLPCVHEALCQHSGDGAMSYHDPLDPQMWRPIADPQTSKRFQDQLEMLKAKPRVVLTKDDINEQGPGPYFQRKDYIGVYDIANVTFDTQNGFRFDFIKRYRQC